LNRYSPEIETLVSETDLSDSLLEYLLGQEDATLPLRRAANKVRLRNKGAYVKRRALIEISNDCLNNCLYCGIRAANKTLPRYCLATGDIIDAAHNAYRKGLRTFVLQGGENPGLTDDMVTETIRQLKKQMPDAAVTLSLGERPAETYDMWRKAGADRYLLRHETFNAAHYRSLHPANMSRENRLRCLRDLADAGYRVGTGFLVGSPGQNTKHIVEDLRFIKQFGPGMIGIGPFVPAGGTPFAKANAGSISLTLRCISILRLMNPTADIPSTTALHTLGGLPARLHSLLGGANVTMPNFTPHDKVSLYTLYDNKSLL